MSVTAYFVTGQPGVGKSTLVQRCVSQLLAQGVTCRGFYTEEVRSGGERIGFDVVTLDGRRGPLARAGAQRSRAAPTVGKYTVDVSSFERLALPQLQPRPGVQLYVIDEVGKMELFSPAFFPAVQSLLDAVQQQATAGALVLGTVPVARYGRTIPQVEAVKSRPGIQVVTIAKESRDREAQALLAALRQRLCSTAGSGSRCGT